MAVNGRYSQCCPGASVRRRADGGAASRLVEFRIELDGAHRAGEKTGRLPPVHDTVAIPGADGEERAGKDINARLEAGDARREIPRPRRWVWRPPSRPPDRPVSGWQGLALGVSRITGFRFSRNAEMPSAKCGLARTSSPSCCSRASRVNAWSEIARFRDLRLYLRL